MFEGMSDGALLERVFGDHREMLGIIDGDDAGSRHRSPLGVLARLVHLETVGVVLVIADADVVFLETPDQVHEQGGFTHPGVPGETDEGGFESFPVPVHRKNALSL